MNERVEQIAAEVHEAWMEAKRAQGVTSRPSEWGEEQMVPYADLSERAKDLDRSTVVAVLDAMAAVEAEALAELQRLSDKAEPGSWRVCAEGSEGSRFAPEAGDIRTRGRFIGIANGRVQPEDGHNAAFLVACVNHVRNLLAPTPRPVAAEQTTPGTGGGVMGAASSYVWADVGDEFGSAQPYGSCNAVVRTRLGQTTVCGFPRRADGTCLDGHPAAPVPVAAPDEEGRGDE